MGMAVELIKRLKDAELKNRAFNPLLDSDQEHLYGKFKKW
jgi:hypothetical protein